MSIRVSTVILAAGASARYGAPKQLALYNGVSLLQRVVDASIASRAYSTSVVLGANAGKIEPILEHRRITKIFNPDWSEGIASSIRAGVKSLTPDIDAVLFLLVDQPSVSTELIDSILSTSVSTGQSMVACEYGGTVGVPALFRRDCFPKLLALSGDRGARLLLESDPGSVARVPFPQGVVDIDAPEGE